MIFLPNVNAAIFKEADSLDVTRVNEIIKDNNGNYIKTEGKYCYYNYTSSKVLYIYDLNGNKI